MASKSTLNLHGRIATVKRTGERFLVQQLVLATGMVHCWGDVLSYRGTSPKFTESRIFRRDDVNITDSVITPPLLSELIHQTRKAPAMQAYLMRGDVNFVEKKDRSEARFATAPTWSICSDVHKCPCHETPMRLRRGPKGGVFWSCSTRGETGCNVTRSYEDPESIGDPDRVLKIASIEDDIVTAA